MSIESNEPVEKTAGKLLGLLNNVAGDHPGSRPIHSKCIIVRGRFKPSATVSTLSEASHPRQPSTPVIARFSSTSGGPHTPDTDPNSNPRGLAVRFLPEHHPYGEHIDIVSVALPLFPARDKETAYGFFKGLAMGTVEEYLTDHPEALEFVQVLKLFPASLASERYYSINAFKLVNDDCKETFVRYRWVHKAGVIHLTDEQAKVPSPGYLFDSVPARLGVGPMEFDLVAQVAEEGDVKNDYTKRWPEEREMVTLGTVSLESVMEDEPAQDPV